MASSATDLHLVDTKGIRRPAVSMPPPAWVTVARQIASDVAIGAARGWMEASVAGTYGGRPLPAPLIELCPAGPEMEV